MMASGRLAVVEIQGQVRQSHAGRPASERRHGDLETVGRARSEADGRNQWLDWLGLRTRRQAIELI
jgi:hypothetical protein